MKIFYAVLIAIATLFAGSRVVAQKAGHYTSYVAMYSPNYSSQYSERRELSLTATPGKYDAGGNGDPFSFYSDSGKPFYNWSPVGRTPANSGFMTTDNPGHFPYYPGNFPGYTSAVYNNTFDSVRNILYFHYGYGADTGATGEASYSTQIYEKWVADPAINSFSPTVGPAGTAVTLSGIGFTNVTAVLFNDVEAQFTIVSDTEIQAIAPVSTSGGIAIRAGAYAIQTGPDNAFLYQSTEPNLLAPRTTAGLYSEGDTTSCRPWPAEYPNWTSLTTTDSLGTHLEVQTLFQDDPGTICGFQSYVGSTDTFADTTWNLGGAYYGSYFASRNYRMTFSGAPLAHPAGVRLFFTAAEIDSFIKFRNDRVIGDVSPAGLNIIRYDGPNEDTTSTNDVGIDTGYTILPANFYYYGPNNEYCYFEFYTDRFSQFYVAALTHVFLLPVKIVSFTASLQNHTTTLSWQTADETNTAYYTIQRSTDGVHFTGIGKMSATGTSGSHNYRYTDDVSAMNIATKIYYRLLATDKDGSARQSTVVNVDVAGSRLITIQPNPARSYAVVNFSMAGTKTVTVTDMNGRRMLVKTTAGNSETINVSSFAKGMYLVRVDYNGGFHLTKLLVE